jgi:hypothetical protein
VKEKIEVLPNKPSTSSFFENDSTYHELLKHDQQQLNELISVLNIHPTSLIKLFVRFGNNSKRVMHLISNRKTKIPNQVSISELRNQIEELSKIHFSVKGKVEIDIVSKLFFLFDEDRIQVKEILGNPFSKLPSPRPFSLSQRINSLRNVDFYYFQYLSQTNQNLIINEAEKNQMDLSSFIDIIRANQMKQLMQT